MINTLETSTSKQTHKAPPYPAFAQYQTTAHKRFHELSWPTRKDERWRFSQPNELIIDNYEIPSSIDKNIIESITHQKTLNETLSGHLIFIDGQCIYKNITQSLLENPAVLCLPLDEALTAHPSIFKNYYLKNRPSIGSEKFHALHEMYAGYGTFIYIPENINCEAPFLIEHWYVANNSLMTPHTLIVAQPHATVNVIESYQSFDTESTHTICGVSHTYGENHAQIFKKTYQSLNQLSRAVQIEAAWAHEHTNINQVSIHLGGHYSRFENQAFLIGEKSHVQLAALTVANDKQIFDQRSLQIHTAANATSDLLYKNALSDQATTIFSGMIIVEPNAQKTDAYQTNRNLLLSKEAEAIALPGLEIEANDVKCSHGATTAPMDAEALFYFRSRGIPQHIAEKLLVFGFFEEVLERVKSPLLIENAHLQIEKKFHIHSL